jgi:magnesium-transporting ATPase (P-type)
MNETTSWHSLTVDQALQSLETTRKGLSTAEAEQRLHRYGANVIPEPPPSRLLAVYLDQFKNAFIYLLLIAAAVSVFLGEYSDAIFIAVALQINAVIGTVQEWQAQEKALGLRSLVTSSVTVQRDGERQTIDGRSLVPGDVVELESGTGIPAAMRLLEDEALQVDESLLTGESTPVTKRADLVLEEIVSLADRTNMLHAGTTILHGRATAVVTATGLRTEVGQVADSLKYIEAVTPPLIGRMEKFTHTVATLMVGVIALIAFAEFLRDIDPTSILLTSVALAVAAIPEGLPVALTVALAISVSRMAKRGVVVRKMAAVEGLGACTLIAADKTGTLTVNELSVQRVFLPEGADLAVADLVTESGQTPGENRSDAFSRLVKAGLLCNEAELEDQDDGSVQIFGDTVDGAFLKLGRAAAVDKTALDREYPRIDRIPYEPALAFAASFHRREDSPNETAHACVKGAAEVILPFCRVDTAQQIKQQVDKLAAQGYRVLALAEGPVSGTRQDHLRELEFLGDPVPERPCSAAVRRVSRSA